jgi:gliding motility-associated-like protein
MKKIIYLLVFCCGISSSLLAQLLPSNRPEQDACNALVICGNGFSSPYSYQGRGTINDPGVIFACGPNAEETASMWLRLNITSSGTLVFNITPALYTDDYDFAIFNVTNKSCNNISNSDVVRCNFNKNNPVTNNGVVGLSTSASNSFVQSGTAGSNFVAALQVTAGESYLLMINNFGDMGQPSSGFSINFTGTTAVFNDQIPPKMTSAAAVCPTQYTTTIQLSEPIKCNSISANGSDFELVPNHGTVVAATGVNCSGSNGYTSTVNITWTGNLTGGTTYTIKAKNGTDNNTLLDFCDNAMSTALAAGIPLVVKPSTNIVNSIDTAGCYSVTYRNHTYTSSTTLIDTFRNQQGCDSAYFHTNIIVYNPSTENFLVESCDSVVFRGLTYYQPAQVTDTFRNYLGCDSVYHVYTLKPQYFTLSVTADPPEPVINDIVHFSLSSTMPDYSVDAWLPTDWFKFQHAENQVIQIPGSDTVKVIATSALGCVDTAILYMKADTLVPIVKVPNAFSPNGDGLNDYFEPWFVNKSGYVVEDFRVYNRWGNQVFKAQGTKKARWDGYYSDKEEKAPTGVYYYFVSVRFIDGTVEKVKGDVTLLR